MTEVINRSDPVLTATPDVTTDDDESEYTAEDSGPTATMPNTTIHGKLWSEIGYQKLKTRRVRSQQKQREPEQRGGCSVVAYKPMGGVSVLRSPETASKAESFEEVCWRTDRGAQQTTTTRHDSNHSTCNNASKSWRSDVPIILLGWEHHTGGSRSKPTVHPCLVLQGGCGLLTQQFSTDAPTSPTLQHKNRKMGK